MGAFGDGYLYHVTGLIHDPRGFPTQRSDEVQAFVNRIHREIEQHFDQIHMVRKEEAEDAEVLVITYGSVARSARHAVREARKQGIKAGLLQLLSLWPFPRSVVEPDLRKARAVLVPELNKGQMSREVKRVNKGVSRVETLRRVDGQLIAPNEILLRLTRM